MMHLSRFSEELVLWMSPQFGFIDLPDRFCTGSSIMPQKKNPDVPELARGKTGRVFGHLMGLLTLMKGQPLAYNKDNQEDKEPLFDAVDTLHDTLRIFADMVPATGLTVKPEAMERAALKGFSTATDLADYLVQARACPSATPTRSWATRSRSRRRRASTCRRCRWTRSSNSIRASARTSTRCCRCRARSTRATSWAAPRRRRSARRWRGIARVWA